SIVAADVNRDGKIDLVTANELFGRFSVLLGGGDGTFVWGRTLYEDPSRPARHLAAPDLNGDGAPDLVVVNNGITVFLNTGPGIYYGDYGSYRDYAVGVNPQAVAAADLNEDGKVDIVVTSAGSNYVSVFLGGGNGTLGPRPNFTTGAGPGRVAILDAHGDNHLDLAITNLGSSNVSVL